MVELERNRELLRDFGLTTAAELLDARLEEASNHEMTYLTFLSSLLEAEEQARKRRSEETRLGYMQLDRNSAELFFRLICERYENGSIILTSNKFFSDWGELMNDTAIATAILDRLLHHAHVVNIRGESYRLKDRLKTGV